MIEAGKNPVDEFIRDLKIHRLEKLHGSTAVADVVEQLQALPKDIAQEQFIDHIRTIVEPFLRAELVDPEVRRRTDALNVSIEVEFKDEETDQSLRGHVCAIDHDVSFQDQATVNMGETVFEIA